MPPRIRIRSKGLPELKKAKAEFKDRLIGAYRYLLRHLAENFLRQLKANIPSGEFESIYSDGLYIADVATADRDRVAVAIAVRPQVWQASNADFERAVIMFRDPPADSPSLFAKEVADMWTGDTLPHVVGGYPGDVVVRDGRPEEVDFVRKGRLNGADNVSDVGVLTAKLQANGFKVNPDVPLEFNEKPLIDLKFYILRMEFGPDSDKQHWRIALRNIAKNRSSFLRTLESGGGLQKAMEMLTNPQDRTWRREMGLSAEVLSERDVAKFADFAKRVNPS